MFYILLIALISLYIVLKFSYVTNYKEILFFVTILVIVFFTPKQ